MNENVAVTRTRFEPGLLRPQRRVLTTRRSRRATEEASTIATPFNIHISFVPVGIHVVFFAGSGIKKVTNTIKSSFKYKYGESGSTLHFYKHMPDMYIPHSINYEEIGTSEGLCDRLGRRKMTNMSFFNVFKAPSFALVNSAS